MQLAPVSAAPPTNAADRALVETARAAIDAAATHVDGTLRELHDIDLDAPAGHAAIAAALMQRELASLEHSYAGLGDAITAINHLTSGELVARAGTAVAPALEAWEGANDRLSSATWRFRQLEPARETNAQYGALLVRDLGVIGRALHDAARSLTRLT